MYACAVADVFSAMINYGGSVAEPAQSQYADAGPLHEPWQVVSTLASEYGHAVKGALGNDQDVTTSGDVRHERKIQCPPRISLDQADTTLQSVRHTQPRKGHATTSAIQAEVVRVSSTIAEPNAAKEVFLRFDFMSERDSRVCPCL